VFKDDFPGGLDKEHVCFQNKGSKHYLRLCELLGSDPSLHKVIPLYRGLVAREYGRSVLVEGGSGLVTLLLRCRLGGPLSQIVIAKRRDASRVPRFHGLEPREIGGYRRRVAHCDLLLNH
jgi:hypothetical protein